MLFDLQSRTKVIPTLVRTLNSCNIAYAEMASGLLKMTDVVDKATRSRMMSGIRGKNTRPELTIRKMLFAAGYRYRLHVPKLPGKPDLVFAKYNAAIFVHGCFWHGHNCKYASVPKSNTEFWMTKITNNKERDAKNLKKLQGMGWRCLVIWECTLRSVDEKARELTLLSTIEYWLKSDLRIDEI